METNLLGFVLAIIRGLRQRAETACESASPDFPCHVNPWGIFGWFFYFGE